MTKAPLPKEQGPHTHHEYSAHNPFDEVLSRVEGAKETRPAPGMVRSALCHCPAHKDKRPSLFISETEDGRVLMHCRAACDTGDVLAALGLEWVDIMPAHLRHNRMDGNRSPHQGPRFSAWAALRVLAFEATVVAIAAGRIGRRLPLSDADVRAVLNAEAEIQHLIDAGGFTR